MSTKGVDEAQNSGVVDTGIYEASPDALVEGQRASLRLDNQGRLIAVVSGITLDPGDVSIGAVEIKDDDSDDRSAVVNAPPAETIFGLVVRPIAQSFNTAADSGETVGVASTSVLAANAARHDAEFVNDSDEPIYLARGNAAVIGAGIRLNANGGSYSIGQNNLFTGEMFAICASGGKNLTVSEG